LRLACIASISIGFYAGLKHFSLFGGGPKNGRRGGEEMLALFPVKAKKCASDTHKCLRKHLLCGLK